MGAALRGRPGSAWAWRLVPASPSRAASAGRPCWSCGLHQGTSGSPFSPQPAPDPKPPVIWALTLTPLGLLVSLGLCPAAGGSAWAAHGSLFMPWAEVQAASAPTPMGRNPALEGWRRALLDWDTFFPLESRPSACLFVNVALSHPSFSAVFLCLPSPTEHFCTAWPRGTQRAHGGLGSLLSKRYPPPTHLGASWKALKMYEAKDNLFHCAY